jgi:hypothetical protein
MTYFEKAKTKLVEWAYADQTRLLKLYDTFGTIDVAQVCDTLSYRENVITVLANVMGASSEEIKEINSIE